MSEIILRVGHNDHRVLQGLLTDPGSLPPRHSRLLRRVVVDATAIGSSPVFAEAARDSGTQLLVDPQTVFLTTEQGPDDTWARLPFASPDPLGLTELADPARRARLVAAVVDFQVDAGATAVIAPYLHLTDLDSHYVDLQLSLIRDTLTLLEDRGERFGILPVLSVDLAKISLDATEWQQGMGRLVRGAAKAADLPLALGLSITTARTKTNLHKMSRIWRRVAHTTPFVAWHAGDVGHLAIAMGASGYEVGMCTAERYNARQQQCGRRPSGSSAGPRFTGVHVDGIGRSLSLQSVRALSAVRAVRGDLACFDPTCCRDGLTSLLGDNRRRHAVRARLSDVHNLDGIAARGWKLHHIARRAEEAEAAARRLRRAADRLGIKVGAYPNEYAALREVALGLRETARTAIA